MHLFNSRCILASAVDEIPRLLAYELVASEAEVTAVALAGRCKTFEICKEGGSVVNHLRTFIFSELEA